MHKVILSLLAIAPFAVACGGSFPVPTQRLADAQSAERSASELGAANEPNAQLSLKLAQEQISLAQKAITDGDNKRADSLLIRAKADAELSIALAREKSAKTDVAKAVEESNNQKTTNTVQGASK